MKILFVLLVLSHTGLTVKYTLTCLATASSGLDNFPEFVSTSTLDDDVYVNCYSDTKTVQSTQDWFTEVLRDDPEHLEAYAQQCVASPRVFGSQIDKIKGLLKQTEGVHTLQHRYGLEWDDESGETNAFSRYGYDGEDLVILDVKAMKWIVSKLNVSPIVLDLEPEKDKVQQYVHIFISVSKTLLKQYVPYGGSSLQRTDLPSVSLLQKSPSSPVTCFATGFFPKHALIFWRKDGEELFEDVKYGDILPNPDGSFQMSADLNISVVKTEHWRRYECVFQLSGVKEDIVTKLEKAAIRSNREKEFPTGLVTAVIVGSLLLTVCIAAFFSWRKNNSGAQEAVEVEEGDAEL